MFSPLPSYPCEPGESLRIAGRRASSIVRWPDRMPETQSQSICFVTFGLAGKVVKRADSFEEDGELFIGIQFADDTELIFAIASQAPRINTAELLSMALDRKLNFVSPAESCSMRQTTTFTSRTGTTTLFAESTSLETCRPMPGPESRASPMALYHRRSSQVRRTLSFSLGSCTSPTR